MKETDEAVPKAEDGWRESVVVGEHSGRRGREVARLPGASGKENVGMSNDKGRTNAPAENPRFPGPR